MLPEIYYFQLLFNPIFKKKHIILLRSYKKFPVVTDGTYSTMKEPVERAFSNLTGDL
jgi:hypothetical protein